MRAGRLDRRVTNQTKTVAQDDYGQPIETWSDLLTIWAGKRDVRASEKFAAAQVAAEIDTVFTARHAPALVLLRPEQHRLLCDGRAYQVHGMTEIGRREAVEIACAARLEEQASHG